MQRVKVYSSGRFKKEARYQFLKDLDKMRKEGWHLHTLTDQGVGKGPDHTGLYRAVYEKSDEEFV